ncbi:MAG: hypothetical protein K2Q25_07820, partial [Mycobacteriaceae bacterium]|nr:hypothetical protein [Mycobacteriaceae bacterium]
VGGGAPTQIGASFSLPGSGAMVSGAAYNCAAIGWTFTITGPSGLSVSVTDSSHISMMGASYRYGGFGTDGWARQSTLYNTAGTATYTVPGWVTSGHKFDLVGVGGGGGGSAGVFQIGGKAGLWNAARLVYGTDTSASTFSVTVGAPGAGANVIPGNNATAGTASSVTASGYGTLSAAGGAAMANASVIGESPGNYAFNNIGYIGGAVSTIYYTNGNPPGGGGIGLTAGRGAPGAVWITAIDTSVPGSLGAWAFYDSATAGPTAGYVSTSESTTSTTYADLTTTSDTITVNIGASGCALVFISSKMGQPTAGAYAFMSFALTGANTQSADDSMSIGYQTANNGGTSYQGSPFLLTGLASGATTFKAKYRVSTGTGTFANRRIAVIPL